MFILPRICPYKNVLQIWVLCVLCGGSNPADACVERNKVVIIKKYSNYGGNHTANYKTVPSKPEKTQPQQRQGANIPPERPDLDNNSNSDQSQTNSTKCLDNPTPPITYANVGTSQTEKVQLPEANNIVEILLLNFANFMTTMQALLNKIANGQQQLMQQFTES